MSPIPRDTRNLQSAELAKVVRGITLMVDLNSDKTTTAIVGVLNLSSRRYSFVRLPKGEWWGDKTEALGEAVQRAAWAMTADEEFRRISR